MSFTSVLAGLYATLKTSGVIGSKPTTYSFDNIYAAISHPSTGNFDIRYTGVGDLTISWITERTSHDISADGSTFILKNDGNNGFVSMSVQQTSELHRWLLQLAGYLMTRSNDPSIWAEINMTIQDKNTSSTYQCTGGSFVKIPDLSYQAQGQRPTWILYFGDISTTATSGTFDLISSLPGIILS